MKQKLSEAAVKLWFGPLSPVNVYSVLYLLVFGFVVLLFIPKTAPALLFPLYFLVSMLVVTSLNRTLPLRWVVISFMYGATLVAFLILMAAWPFNHVLGLDSVFRSAVIIPILEETAKIVPLLLFLAWKRWRFRWTAGAIDLMIVGAALGAGYTFFEDALLGFIPGGIRGMTSGQYLLASHGATPHLGPIYLFPSMDVGYANTAFIGHTAAAAFVALAVGQTRLLKGRFGGLVWILPLAVWFWMVVDHGLFNYVALVGRMSGFTEFLYTLNAYGRLSSIVFYLLVLGTIAYERLLLRRNHGRAEAFVLDRQNLQIRQIRLGDDPLVYAGAVNKLRVYLRERRGLSYGLHYYHSQGADTTETGKERLVYLKGVAGYLAVWKSYVEVTPTLGWAQTTEQLAVAEDDRPGTNDVGRLADADGQMTNDQ